MISPALQTPSVCRTFRSDKANRKAQCTEQRHSSSGEALAFAKQKALSCEACWALEVQSTAIGRLACFQQLHATGTSRFGFAVQATAATFATTTVVGPE